MTTSYLRFIREPRAETGTTQVWLVLAARSGDPLGVIRWFGRWRQYAIEPERNTVWSNGCLRDVETFVAGLMAEWRASKVKPDRGDTGWRRP